METVGEESCRAADLVICVTSAPKAIVIHEKVAPGAGQILEEVDQCVADHGEIMNES